MCGIAGVLEKQDSGVLGAMLDSIAHRGPDGTGQYRSLEHPWTVSLGHRRLAIIDVESGAQPMTNENDSVVISYNGEVYNFLDLRPSLEAKGHVFRTRSDTEVIIHHLEQHGIDGVRDLNGMFAFALWEARHRRLLLARDRMGIKPLFYASLPDGGIAFASELTALLAHPGVDRTPSVEGLASYLFSDYFQPPHTVLRGVRQLEAGHVLVWENGRLHGPRRFWELSMPEERPLAPDRELAGELWSRLGTAVERQLIADVPVGILLSGGLDSSSVATIAAARAGKRLMAFNIGFEDASFDESKYARLMAEHLGLDFVQDTLHQGNLLQVLDVALDKLDQPLADASYLPTFLLSRLASRHVKVVVGGDGGDELWGGYPTYQAHRVAALYARVPRFVRERIVPRVIDWLPINDTHQSLEWKLRRFTGRWDDDPMRRHLRWMSSIDLPNLASAIVQANGIEPVTLGSSIPRTTDPMSRLMALDFSTYMSGSVLTKVDRASMAHGLEVRPPLLDNEMVDWAFSLPSRYKVRRGKGKYLLKLAASGRVPDRIIHRRKKGFGIPLAVWLRGPLRERIESILGSSPIWDLGLCQARTFRTWNDEHQKLAVDHAKPLWALLVLDHWLRRQREFPPASPGGLFHLATVSPMS